MSGRGSPVKTVPTQGQASNVDTKGNPKLSNVGKRIETILDDSFKDFLIKIKPDKNDLNDDDVIKTVSAAAITLYRYGQNVPIHEVDAFFESLGPVSTKLLKRSPKGLNLSGPIVKIHKLLRRFSELQNFVAYNEALRSLVILFNRFEDSKAKSIDTVEQIPLSFGLERTVKPSTNFVEFYRKLRYEHQKDKKSPFFRGIIALSVLLPNLKPLPVRKTKETTTTPAKPSKVRVKTSFSTLSFLLPKEERHLGMFVEAGDAGEVVAAFKGGNGVRLVAQDENLYPRSLDTGENNLLQKNLLEAADSIAAHPQFELFEVLDKERRERSYVENFTEKIGSINVDANNNSFYFTPGSILKPMSRAQDRAINEANVREQKRIQEMMEEKRAAEAYTKFHDGEENAVGVSKFLQYSVPWYYGYMVRNANPFFTYRSEEDAYRQGFFGRLARTTGNAIADNLL